VVVDRYVFDPDAGVGEAALNATKGALRMVTGRISEMPNKDIKVTTTFGALAVRGTDFWSGSVSGKTGVLLVHNSRLEVRGENRCAVTLDQAEEGTYIDRRTGCPLLPRLWSAAEINAALSMTSFSLAFAPSQVLPAAAGLAAGLTGFAVSASQNNNQGPTFTQAEPTSP
jgi:hypothetical protein